MDRDRNLEFSLFLISITTAVFMLIWAVIDWSKMIPPYGPQASMTFWAAVPVLAGILALFLLRDRDRMLAWGGR